MIGVSESFPLPACNPSGAGRPVSSVAKDILT
jgi:hypothetical protein